MSRATRKGYRIEKQCVDTLCGWAQGGLPIRAKRGDGTIGEDVYMTLGLAEFRIECKGRKDGKGFAMINAWLQGADALWLHADRQAPGETLVVMRADTLRDMLREAQASGGVDAISSVLLTAQSPRNVGGHPETKA